MTKKQPKIKQGNVTGSITYKQVAKNKLMYRSKENYSKENFESHLLE